MLLFGALWASPRLLLSCCPTIRRCVALAVADGRPRMISDALSLAALAAALLPTSALTGFLPLPPLPAATDESRNRQEDVFRQILRVARNMLDAETVVGKVLVAIVPPLVRRGCALDLVPRVATLLLGVREPATFSESCVQCVVFSCHQHMRMCLCRGRVAEGAPAAIATRCHRRAELPRHYRSGCHRRRS